MGQWNGVPSEILQLKLETRFFYQQMFRHVLQFLGVLQHLW